MMTQSFQACRRPSVWQPPSSRRPLRKRDSAIQQHVLAMPETIHRSTISEHTLRLIAAQLHDITEQKARFQRLIVETRQPPPQGHHASEERFGAC